MYPKKLIAALEMENIENGDVVQQQQVMRDGSNPRPLTELQMKGASVLTNNTNIPVTIETKLDIVRPPVKKTDQIIDVTLVALAPNDGVLNGEEITSQAIPPAQESFKESVLKIENSQKHYLQLFGRVNTMLQTLMQRYDGQEHADVDPLRATSTSPDDLQLQSVFTSRTEKYGQYPQHLKMENGSYAYVLGPNGTQVNEVEFNLVSWESAQTATRCLLMSIFSSDVLATHTLTGKPSPAFYGRERPEKMQLDPAVVEDIIITVQNRTGGKERHIRGTITTKCADTAKRYKRRAVKGRLTL